MAPPRGVVGPGLCDGPGTKWPWQDCAWTSTLDSGRGSPLSGEWPISFQWEGVVGVRLGWGCRNTGHG